VIGLLAALLAPPLARGQWVEAPGTGWVDLSLSHHATGTRFDENANTEPLFNEDSRSVTTSAFLTGALGLVRGIDVWAQVPFHRLQFDDAVRERTSTGLGDPRVFVRAGPELFGFDSFPVPVALRGGVKFSVGDFPVDAEIIPLTEGQRDWEVLLELGHSFHPLPVYAMGWIGYRWRETNTEINRKPGDERLFFAAVGGQWRQLTWEMAVDGLFGRPPTRTLASGVELSLQNDTRELVQLLPTVGWRVGPGVLEVGGRLPVHGQNLPAGPALTLGYFMTFSAW
jgi:hypothetical protein